MKRLASYFFTQDRINSRGKYINFSDGDEPDEVTFKDLLDSIIKPKIGSNYQDQADVTAVNARVTDRFVTPENLPVVEGDSYFDVTETPATNATGERHVKYVLGAKIVNNISNITSRVTSKLVTPANLPVFALDNSAYTAVDGQTQYYESSITETPDNDDFFVTYKLKMKALTSAMMTHGGTKLSTVLDALQSDYASFVTESELSSAVSSLTSAINLKATKVNPTFVTGYNGTKVTVNSQGIVTSVSKASASDIANDSSVSGTTVKDALNWLKTNGGGGTVGASDTDDVNNSSDVSGATATDAFNTLLAATQQYFVKDVIGKTNGDTLDVDKINVLNLTGDTSFTLPTPSLSLKGKVLIVVQSNASNARAEIFGAAQGPIVISDFRDVLVFNCVYDVGGGGEWFMISRDDSKMCPVSVIVESGSHTASANENIKANAQSLGADITITIPTSLSEGRMIYVYYPTGSPSAYVVDLTGGYTATLVQGDWFLLRDNGSFWVAIGSSQNTPDLSAYELIANKDVANGYAGLDSSGKILTSQLPDIAITDYLGSVASQVAMLALTGQKGDWAIRTDTGTVFIITGSNPAVIGSWTEMAYPAAAVANVLGTLNRVTVSGGTTKTIDIASTYVGQTSITTLGTIGTGVWQGTSIADAYIASASTWNGKFNTPTGLTTNYVSKWNGSAFVDSLVLSTSSGVGINAASIDASAMFQVNSTTQGVLFPRMDTTQRNAIVSPAQSLLVFDTTLNNFFYRHGGGYWQPVGNVDTVSAQQITGNKQFTSFSLDFLNLGASLPSLTSTYNARYIPLWSNSSTILSLYSNLGGGVYVTMNSQFGSNWYRQHTSGTFLTYPCGTQIGSGVAPIYSSVNPTTGAAYEITITPDTGGSLGSMYCIAIVDANNIVTNLIKVKPSLNPSNYDLNLVSNKLQTSGSNASNVVFRGITGFRGGQTNLAQAFWRYSADLSSAAIGGSAPNATTQLHLQSTTLGLGLPSVPTSAGLAATLAGNLRYNPTTVVPEYADGSRWVKLPKHYTQVTTKTIANTTTETSMFNDTGALGTRTIPGSSTQVGSYFRIRLDGYFGSTAGPFVTVQIKMGSVVIFDTTLTATFSPSTPQQWFVEAYFTVQSVGSGTSATVFGQGRFCYATSPSTQYNVLFTTNTAVSSGYDSTASQVLDVTFKWNTADAANTITTTNAVIEQIN